MNNLETVSNASTATNYAQGYQTLVPVRPELAENGPFVHNPKKHNFPTHFIVTKSHCAGYCVDCSPRYYVHTVESFLEGCLSGQKNDGNGSAVVKTKYDESVPRRAIHLIRSPFDNIVARMHLAVRTQIMPQGSDLPAEIFSNTRKGLAAWCELMDFNFPEKELETDLISPEVKELWKDLPCHSDWYRYVQVRPDLQCVLIPAASPIFQTIYNTRWYFNPPFFKWHNLAIVSTSDRLFRHFLVGIKPCLIVV